MRATGPSLVLLIALVSTPTALAHGDRALGDGEVDLAPGGSVTFVQELHYHRLVGLVEALDAPGAALEVRVAGPEGNEQVLAGPGGRLRLNELVPCCKDEAWQEHTFSIVNTGDERVTVRHDLVLLHDNLVIVVENAETGALFQTTLLVVAIAGGAGLLSRRPGEPDVARARRSRRIGIWTLVAAWLVGGALAAYGSLRYGGGPLAGSIAGTAIAPSDAGLFNTHALVMLGLMALWATALVGWADAMRRATRADAFRTKRLGEVIAGGCIAIGGVLALEYGAVVSALLVSVLPAIVVLFGVHGPRPALTETGSPEPGE